MDVEGLDNALSLGSSPQAYHEYTLSKFGLGLKSAAASIGMQLEIITRPKSDLSRPFKAMLDFSKITSDYYYELFDPTAEDIATLNSLTGGGAGNRIPPSLSRQRRGFRIGVAFFQTASSGRSVNCHSLTLVLLKQGRIVQCPTSSGTVE